jgi:hypothetical protein
VDYVGDRYYRFALIYAGDPSWVTTTVKDGELSTIPQTIKLEAYPNPFTPTTKVRFTLPTAEMVSLSIISISGELIEKRELGESETTVAQISKP